MAKKTPPSQLLKEEIISFPKITKDDFKLKKLLAVFIVLIGVCLVMLTVVVSAQLYYYPTLCPTMSPTVSVRKSPGAGQITNSRRSIMNLGEVAVGKTLSPDGRVAKNEVIFTNRDTMFYLTAELIGPESNREVTVSLFSLDPRIPDNRTLIETQSALVRSEDQDVVQFQFPRPEKTWQTFGKYQAVVEIPNSGSRKTVHFAIYR